MAKSFDKEALVYHSAEKPGKVDVRSSKKCDTEYDLSLAYSPGVAAPCKEIAKSPAKVYDYTTKGNLVAVITNGSAVLGLGDIGPLASKPVMEGKGVLFKKFANIDVFDLELKTDNIEDFIQSVKTLEPTFGGINLEDIKAPDCFIIEERLKEEMNIPVFHDDQHGTAIITAAALINACMVSKKKLKNIKIVVNGAGAAAIACAKLFMKVGVLKKNITMCDSRGVIHTEREEGMNKYKKQFAQKTKNRTLTQALKGADVFCGLSVAGALTPAMLKGMAKKPIVFAMANPDPEILPKDAIKVRPDVIMATGRSDFPNQVNNVLGFPSIFRGALDVQATHINEEMKFAAAKALAELARQDVPDSVSEAYGNRAFTFGPDYIIPKPFDHRVLTTVAPAVAKAAMDTKVARKPVKNLELYKEQLEAAQSFSQGFIRTNINKIKSYTKKSKGKKPKIVFPEGNSTKVLKALNTLASEDIIEPVLLGNIERIKETISELELDNLTNIEIITPRDHKDYAKYSKEFYKIRQRKGVMEAEAERLIRNPYYYASMMVKQDDADASVSGAIQNYADCILPIFEIIGPDKYKTAAGLIIILFEDRLLFLTDTTVNIDPTEEQIASIALSASRVAKYYNIEPRVAMLSYSNFTGKKGAPAKMRNAAKLVSKINPKLIVDGEMQADTAVNPSIVERIFPFCNIQDGANILVFPDLNSGNIAYKLIQQLSECEVMGPFLLGINKPANVMQRTCNVQDIINTIVLTAVEAQAYKQRAKKTTAKKNGRK